jgi:hypothetical protein
MNQGFWYIANVNSILNKSYKNIKKTRQEGTLAISSNNLNQV